MKFLKLISLAVLLQTTVLVRSQAVITAPDTIAACLGDTIVLNVLLNDLGDDLELIAFSDEPGAGEFSYLPDGTLTFIPDPADFNEFIEINYLVCSEDDDDDECAVEQIAFYLQPFGDCVWPGDADVDGLANHFDLLTIGLYYGDAGPDRFDTDNSWNATYSFDWDDVPTVGGYLPKWADCNGDGLINAADTLPIQLNYGQLHALRLGDVEILDAAPLYIDLPEDTIAYEDTITLPIILGSDEFPATDVLGLGFTIEYNDALVVPGSMSVQFESGWLGTESSNLFAMRNNTTPGIFDVSVSRNDKTSVSGNGQVGTVSFVMESNLAGKYSMMSAEVFELCVSPLYEAISSSGAAVTLAPTCDTVIVAEEEPAFTYDILVFPNPASTNLRVRVLDLGPVDALVQIKNLAGVTVRSRNIVGGTQANFKVNTLPNGTYTVVVTLDGTVVTETLVVSH